jgi:predicted ATPase
LEDLETLDLKGIAERVRAWVVLRSSSVESRFEALHATHTTSLVGRDEEIELLMRRWRQAKSGRGRVVLLTGEPGIGKSRLVVAVQESVQSDPHTRLRHFCSPHHQDSALYPIVGRLERAAGFARGDTAEEKLVKLEALLAKSNARPEDISYIAELMSVGNTLRYPIPELSPQKRKEKMLTALLAQMERLAVRQPVLTVFEDVQWIDPTTLELLSLMIEQVQRLPVLLLVTARPEFRPPWPAYAYVTNITLGRIGREEGASLIGQLTGGKALPGEVLQQVLARTDGIPLFIEELTKAVVESGVITAVGDRYMLVGPMPSLSIPTSLNASLLARLDRLAPVREVAQVGAALGRRFTHALISAVSPIPQLQLDDALAQLVSTELIFRRGAPPDAEYTFKHVLVQDAAYSTLLRSRRQQLHGLIASTLEEQFPETMETQPEVLARHCGAAGLVEKAIGYWRKAGRQAIACGAMTEALAQLRKGLDLLSAMPDGVARQERELELQIALGSALIATNGYGAPEPGEAFSRARQLCEQLSRPPKLGVLAGQFTFRLLRGELGQAELHAEEMRQLGDAQDDVRCKIIGSNCSGCSSFYLGKLIHARASLENSVSKWDPKFRGIAVTVEDPYATGLIHLSRTLLCLGYVEKACLQRDKGLIEARGLSPYNLAIALYQAWVGDWAMEGMKSGPTMLRSAEQALAIFSDEGLPMWIGLGSIMRGWCLGAVGQATEGVPLMLQGLSAFRATGGKLQIPFALMALAEVQGKSAQPEEGLNRLAEAAKLVESTQERWAEAEIHRLRGVLLLSMGEQAAAEESYHHAIAVAQGQSAKFWELRAATSLGRLWRDQGKRAEARDLLVPVYGWFTEGLDTLDLKEAKALLDELT